MEEAWARPPFPCPPPRVCLRARPCAGSIPERARGGSVRVFVGVRAHVREGVFVCAAR